MVASDRRKWLALALLSAVQFMVVLDIAIVNVALPSIKVDLGFSQENLQWVISAYALLFGGFLLLGGRAADLLGRRRIFLVGVVVFTLSSFLAGLAWSEASLIGARTVIPFNGSGEAAAPVARLAKAALERGLYLMTHWNVVMAVPPLTITRDEVDEGLAILDEALAIADEYVV